MAGARYFFLIMILLLTGTVYLTGVDGGALGLVDWFLSSANKFISAMLNFLRWLVP